jgi:hypothetical protein
MVGVFGDRDAQCVACAQKSTPSGINDWPTRPAPKGGDTSDNCHYRNRIGERQRSNAVTGSAAQLGPSPEWPPRWPPAVQTVSRSGLCGTCGQGHTRGEADDLPFNGPR